MSGDRGAADRVAPAGTAGRTDTLPSMHAPAAGRNHPPVGTCITCRQHIRMTIPSTCGTCRAWHRWYVAHRRRYLGGVAR